MSTVTKIVSFLVAHFATTHRQFRSLLEEMESAYHDVLLHCSGRWLSRGKAFLRFVECLVETRAFLIGQGMAYLGLPYLEKQKAGQWMATSQQAKFMVFSTIVNTKSGRPKGLSPKKKVISCFAAGLVSFSAE